MTTGSSTSGHSEFTKSVTATYSASRLRYIGFRVNRKGPCMTIAVVGCMGLGVVPARRNRNTALPDRISQITIRIQAAARARSEEHTSELQSRRDIVCRLLLEKKKIELQD